jgi:hypothetical protein
MKRLSSMRNAVLAILASLFLSGAALAQPASSDPSMDGHLSLRAETLFWWFNRSPAPVPLITDGLFGDSDTKVLLGGNDLDNKHQNGFRLTAAYSFNDRASLEWSFLAFASRSSSKSVESSGLFGSTDLLLPYFDVTRNRENVTEISFSPSYGGSAREELTRSLMGAEVNGVRALDSSRGGHVELLGGLRWLRLRETFLFTTSSSFNPPEPADIWLTTDRFDARNNFYGAQIGARARYDRGRFFAGGAVKIGVGAMVQSVDIDGFLVTNDFTNFGATQRFPGGYFALPSNIGSYRRAVFAVVPEAELNVGYRITSWASFFAGYSFLYSNNVVRPGNQINRNINPTQSVSWVGEPPVTLEGPAEPSFKFKSSNFWAQGVNAGLSFRF